MKSQIALMFMLVLVGCKNSSVEPNLQILGKWEPFYNGNGEYQPPITAPAGYWQFLEDSVMIEYEYATKKSYRKKYWIDSLLHVATPRSDGFLLTFHYSTKIYADTMQLHVEKSTAIFYVSKWKRIN